MIRYLVENADGSISIDNAPNEDFLAQVKPTVTILGPAADFEPLPDIACKRCWVNNAGTIEVDLDRLRQKRLDEIEAEQKALLELTDKPWVEAMTKSDATMQSEIEADKTAIRAVNNQAVTDLAALTTAEDIMAYDPIPALTLNRTYE